MDRFLKDLSYGARSLRASPAFSLVAILTLGIGIGSTTTVFSVVNGVLLQPLPFHEPERIVWISEHRSGAGRDMAVAWPNFQDWEANTTSFAALGAFQFGRSLVLGGERASSEAVTPVSHGFWEALATPVVTGRPTLPEEHLEGGPDVALIREDLWRSQFGSRRLDEIDLEVYGRRHEVVGVLPTEGSYPENSRIWTPAAPASTSRTAHNWRVLGRLAEGVTRERAEAELDPLQARLVRDLDEDPEYLGDGVTILPLQERVAGSARTPLALLLGAAGFVLLVACTNLASTLLARGAGRSREMAVRSSVGADRRRLLAQLLTESFVLASLGGLLGVSLAFLGLRVIRVAGAGTLPRIEGVSLDLTVLLFAAAATLGTTLLFGLVPSLRVSGQNVADAMRSGRGVREGGRSRGWSLLIATEIGLAVVLAVGAGLLIRSFGAITSVEPGFDPTGVLVHDSQLNPMNYPSGSDHIAYYEDLLGALRASPTVLAAGVGSKVPLSGGVPNGLIQLDGDESLTTTTQYVLASPGYFQALGIGLVAGRSFSDQDRADTRHVAVVNRAFAEANWPGQDPIGRQVTGGGLDEFWEERRFADVIGVVEDARFQALTTAPEPTIFMSHAQRPGRLQFQAVVVARAADGQATSLTPLLRTAIEARDSDVPINLTPFEDRIAGTLGTRRFIMVLLGAFAAVALGLAALGVYGVISYNLERQRREIGIRLALGAEPREVRGMVQGKVLILALVGGLMGILGATALSRFLRSLLYEINPMDPVTLIGACVLLMGAAWLAALIPAYRSSRLDPTEAMRAD